MCKSSSRTESGRGVVIKTLSLEVPPAEKPVERNCLSKTGMVLFCVCIFEVGYELLFSLCQQRSKMCPSGGAIGSAEHQEDGAGGRLEELHGYYRPRIVLLVFSRFGKGSLSFFFGSRQLMVAKMNGRATALKKIILYW